MYCIAGTHTALLMKFAKYTTSVLMVSVPTVDVSCLVVMSSIVIDLVCDKATCVTSKSWYCEVGDNRTIKWPTLRVDEDELVRRFLGKLDASALVLNVSKQHTLH